jgi:quercetin dioxygenase-like cupin family protein
MTTIQQLSNLEATPHANVFPDAEPKTIRLVLEAGEQVDPHRHPDREIVFYLIEGGITLHLGEDTVDLSGGDIVQFDGDQEISPVATETSTALIVLASNQGTER